MNAQVNSDAHADDVWPHAIYDTDNQHLTVITHTGEQGRWWLPLRSDDLVSPNDDLFPRAEAVLSQHGWVVVGNWIDIADTFTAPVAATLAKRLLEG